MKLATRRFVREDGVRGRRLSAGRARWTSARRGLASALTLAVLFAGYPAPALASDGCTVLLCLAGNWRSIDQCVPPVRKALRDLALGRSFPVCGFASAPSFSISMPGPVDAGAPASASLPATPVGSQVTLRWAEEGFCPPQYQVLVEGESTTTALCSFTGAIEVFIAGQLWNRTWWSLSGDSVTEWTAAARAAIPQASADDRFDRDFEAWKAQQGSTAPAPAAQSEGGA